MQSVPGSSEFFNFLAELDDAGKVKAIQVFFDHGLLEEVDGRYQLTPRGEEMMANSWQRVQAEKAA